MNKNCLNCNSNFEISNDDLSFYKRVGAPSPTLCYHCRMQRRLAHRNERFLYHRKCDLSGKQIISAFSTDKPFPVYDIDSWWTDEWSALEYGVDFDFNRPFFEQFEELRNNVPRLALQQQKPMENSAYCNCASKNKNCYLVFSTNTCEDCYYGSWINNSRDCLDNLNIESCELCYQCVGCRDCYDLRYSRDCTSCSNSFFLRDCTSCNHCFGCTSLVQEEYCIFNKKVDKAEYNNFIASLNTGSYQTIKDIKTQIEQAIGVPVVKELHGTALENCSGDYLRHCRDAQVCFECDHSEDIRYCMCVQETKSSMDFSYWGKNAELIYECQACGFDVFNLSFCNLCWSGCSDLTYCDHCFSTKNCFGCVGLKKQEYCIFNKQYSKEDYQALKEKIISHMKETGEWGEFFPISMSTFAYNETLSNEQVPLSQNEVIEKGWPWQEEQDKKKSGYIGEKIELPDDISEVDSSICEKILICEQTGRPYKIIEPELQFYKRLNIPLPRVCPDYRHQKRLMKRNPRILWDRNCQNCNKTISTTYAPARPEKVYCEGCYLESVHR